MNESAEVLMEIRGGVGLITHNRPSTLNALSLPMIRTLTKCLTDWREDKRVHAVAIRGRNKAGPFGAFCAGGDIRFFYQALLSGDPSTEDFFTEEYALNHLIHSYQKPFIAFMDGVVMGGGMGISQGASHRLVTSRTKMAMPETAIGLFPDVGGGYFLSRCPGFSGEWLALTGITLGAGDSLALGLADHCVDEVNLERLWVDLSQMDFVDNTQFDALIASHCVAANALLTGDRSQIDRYFALDSVIAIIRALEADDSDWAQQTATLLRQRSPLMLHVAFEQIRRARKLSIAQDLRMERGVMRHCFYPAHLQRKGSATEVAEGIRARVIGKDNAPLWQPSRIEDVTPEMVQPFFASPWPEQSHPLLLLV